jgi:hypothetical protein
VSTFTAKLSDLLFAAHYILNGDGAELHWAEGEGNLPYMLAEVDDEDFEEAFYVEEQDVDVDTETGEATVRTEDGQPLDLMFKMQRGITPADLEV